jgi:transposase
MSLQEDCWQENIPSETARIGQIILKEDNLYRVLGDGVNKILTLEDFAHLYSRDGRGAVCPIILSLVTLFQYVENLPDREAANLAPVRLDWKYAMHVPVEWLGFHYSTLCNYRGRLLEHGEERLLFEKILEWIVSQGFLKKQGKQRTDSTHVLGKVAVLSRLEMLWETLRMALRAIEKAAPNWYESAIPATYHEYYSVRQSDWKLNQEEVRKETKQAGQDGYWLLDHLQESGPAAVQELPEVKTLETVLEQTFTRSKSGGGGGRKVRLRRQKRGEGNEKVLSPHETEARMAQKRGKGWRGYKLQVTETAETESGSTFLTDVRVTGATTDDSEVVTEIQEQLIADGRAPEEHLVDQGYVSGANMAKSDKRGIKLLGLMQEDTTGKPSGYRQEDFTIDWEHKVVTGPEGKTSCIWRPRVKSNNRPGIYVRFGPFCRDCKAWGICTTSEQGRTLFINAHHELIAKRRAEQQTEAFREKLRARAAVEGTISVMVRKHGARRARYRGKDRVNLQAQLTGAAVNLKQLNRAMQSRRRNSHQLTTDC